MSWVSRDLEDILLRSRRFISQVRALYAGRSVLVAAAGYYSEEEEVYHISQSLGLLSFLWVILEQYGGN